MERERGGATIGDAKTSQGGNAARTNEWHFGGQRQWFVERRQRFERPRGREGEATGKMRCDNQPVQTKRANRGRTTTQATSGDNDHGDHNDLGAS
jgi:hypothetical protein